MRHYFYIELQRHMNMTLKEAYQEFLISAPGMKIGKSKFATLRPSNVLLQADTPHNVCV
jgi:hypothetical protein